MYHCKNTAKLPTPTEPRSSIPPSVHPSPPHTTYSTLFSIYTSLNAKPDNSCSRLYSLFSALDIPSPTTQFTLLPSDPINEPNVFSGGVVFLPHRSVVVRNTLDSLGLGGGWTIVRGEVKEIGGMMEAREKVVEGVWGEIGRFLQGMVGRV